MDEFIANDLLKIKMLVALSKMREQPALMVFATGLPKVEVVDAMRSEATLKITLNGSTWEEPWVKVDRRWLPADMVESCDDRRLARCGHQSVISMPVSPWLFHPICIGKMVG